VPEITDLTVTPQLVKAGDVITVRAKVTDASGISAVSADFSYDENYNNRPSPTSVSMHSVGGDYYEVEYTVPTDWNDGDMYVKVAARDNTGGNWVRSTEQKIVVVDNTAPVLTLDSPAAGDVISGVINLKATCDEECDYVNFWWRAEGESYSNITPDRRYHYIYNNGTEFTWDLNSLNAERWGGDPSYIMADGVYYFKAAAKDVAGNWAGTTEIAVTIDNTAPVVDIIAPSDGNFVKGVVNIEGSVKDVNNDHYWLVVTDASGTTVAGPGTVHDTDSDILVALAWDTTAVADGVYTIKLEARDTAGNKDANSTKWIDVIVDNVAPVVDITNPSENGEYLAGEVTFEGNITEEHLSHYNLSLNPNPNVDGACNETAKEATWDFSKRVWQVDGGTNTVSHNFNTTTVTDGHYVLRLAARDLAGNRDPMSNTGDGDSIDYKCVTIDNTAPALTINSPNDNDFISGQFSVSGDVSDATSGIKVVKVKFKAMSDNSLIKTCLATYDTTSNSYSLNVNDGTCNVPDGSYKIKVRARDNANNETIV
jgi:hypothetical protein